VEIENKMKLLSILIIAFIGFTSCENTKWRKIKGNNIKFGVANAIYFENLQNGLIGSYRLEENSNSENYDRLDLKPDLYITKDGGKKWEAVKLQKNINGGINNLYLSHDTIYCEIDYSPSKIYESFDLGYTWNRTDSIKSNLIKNSKFNKNRYEIDNHYFEFENENYHIKEKYEYKKTVLIICHGEESLTNYYFVSPNNGKSWKFLQKEFGSNRQKFLLNENYLLSYDSGLQVLKLK